MNDNNNVHHNNGNDTGNFITVMINTMRERRDNFDNNKNK